MRRAEGAPIYEWVRGDVDPEDSSSSSSSSNNESQIVCILPTIEPTLAAETVTTYRAEQAAREDKNEQPETKKENVNSRQVEAIDAL